MDNLSGSSPQEIMDYIEEEIRRSTLGFIGCAVTPRSLDEIEYSVLEVFRQLQNTLGLEVPKFEVQVRDQHQVVFTFVEPYPRWLQQAIDQMQIVEVTEDDE